MIQIIIKSLNKINIEQYPKEKNNVLHDL